MIKPSVNELMEKVDSRYTLVIETAKRARAIAEGAAPLVECDSNKPVTIAAHEIAADKVTYSKPNQDLSDDKSKDN